MNDKNVAYVKNALFVHSQENQHRLEELVEFSSEIAIKAVDINVFQETGYILDPSIEHFVVCASIEKIKAVIEHALILDISLGILPTKEQRQLRKYLEISEESGEQIALALQQNLQAMDVVRCNEKIVLFAATMGRILMVQTVKEGGRMPLIIRFFSGLRRIRIIGFRFTLPDRKPIDTAASGCVIVMHRAGNFASRLIAFDENSRDGMISLLIAAPVSVMGYLAFLYRVMKGHITIQNLPDTLGYIKTRGLTIETSKVLQIEIDGLPATKTPARCYVQPLALRLNRNPVATGLTQVDATERIDLGNLPMGSEKTKAMKKKIPFFPYATEERFKDLFVLLRRDARSDTSYFVLMVLSAMLATVGLFLNSSSVIIGAMLLAPLMAPIVSLSMGILRSDMTLYLRSAKTIAAGVLIALAASALITMMLPLKLITAEMLARLNPSLLDLAVAIFAGVAAAYTKSNKAMLSGLAGVAIAVALVPPLAVAGVGLGRGDPHFFGQAFLLFSTNLVGITVSAALTFLVLGYSAAIKAKKSFIYVVLTLALISIPLYLSYDKIVENVTTEQAWKKERYLVNGKYLIVKKTERYRQADRDVIEMEIYARDNLSREDLDAFKAEIRNNSSRKLVIRAKVTYIL